MAEQPGPIEVTPLGSHTEVWLLPDGRTFQRGHRLPEVFDLAGRKVYPPEH